ncbi:MAG: methylamine utilization protein [Sphingorhabdus sp.]|nr:methylamine utilization protein [Sphingorhabdus sp.]
MIAKLSIAAAALSGAVALALSAQAGPGSTLAVQVKDARGLPIKDAVVTIYPAAGVSVPKGFSWPNAMGQKDLAFVPGTLIVAKGSNVAFPNFDRVRHSVYSFSKPAKFEINLYGSDQTRSQSFPIAGTVAVGCNIHDQMRGYIKVVDTPFAAKTDREGRVRFDGLPAGGAKVRIWYPSAVAADNEAEHATSLNGGFNSRSVVLPLRG